LTFRAGRDVRSKQRPRPRLRNPNLEPNRHREKSLKLSEHHLLPCLGGNTLRKQRRSLTRIQMSQKTIYTRFTKPSEFLTEVEELPDGGVGVVVSALFGGGVGTKDVG